MEHYDPQEEAIFPALKGQTLVRHLDHVYANKKALAAFLLLQKCALQEGIKLEICSGYRSLKRQEQIIEGKFTGTRTVLDKEERPLDIKAVPLEERLEIIGRYSALPGLTRHHLGCDFDVYAKNLLPQGQSLQLTAQEYSEEGYFAPLSAFLREHASSFGFYFPYDGTNKSVAFEPWHLSFQELGDALAGSFLLCAWERYIGSLNLSFAPYALGYGQKHYRTLLGLKTL